MKIDHPRQFLHAFISIEVCKELEFIHKGNCTIGYRPNVFSTTLSHLIATNSSHLIMPFVPLRERLKEEVERAFGCEFELFIEFTGLISWTKGSSIGWHSDDNRPYLKQRAFAAVCYLNSYEEDFSGGLFHFQDGEPATIIPKAGDVAIYSADTRNTHSVDEITSGERLTLTLWFTRDASHDEDAKLISLLLSHNMSPNSPPLLIPLPASSNMYWFSSKMESPGDDEQCLTEFDVRLARLAVLGYDVCPSDQVEESSIDDNCGLDEGYLSDVVLEKRVQLVRGDGVLNVEFGNIMHALQVVQFYSWKLEALSLPHHQDAGFLQHYSESGIIIITRLSETQREISRQLKNALLKDPDVAEKVFVHFPIAYDKSRNQQQFSSSGEEGLVAAVKEWEGYSRNLHKQLVMSLFVIFHIVPPKDDDATTGWVKD